MVETVPAAHVAFRTIGDLAERCGQYCWLENGLFELTGRWATAAVGVAEGTAEGAAGGRSIEAEARVVCSEASAWHGFMAGQWRSRLPVRAGVDAGALVLPPPGPAAQALDHLGTGTDVLGALGGLVEEILPALLAAYEEHLAHASPVSEAPVRALLGLALPRAQLEIERGHELLRRAAATDRHVAARHQPLLGVGGTIFPAARAS